MKISVPSRCELSRVPTGHEHIRRFEHMKMAQSKFTISRLVVLLSLFLSVSGWALEPQTLFNFQLGLGPVIGALLRFLESL
jgi:hypothetical protein